jgi:arsenic resistance protein ArsH
MNSTATSTTPTSTPSSTPDLDPYDDPAINALYRPFLLPVEIRETDWISQLELDSVSALAATTTPRLKFLVLYGSLRARSYSRLMAFEASRILHRLGADVRVFDPSELPVKDDVQHDHPKVQELRKLSAWSDGHVWCSPEQHGNLVCSPQFPLSLSPY